MSYNIQTVQHVLNERTMASLKKTLWHHCNQSRVDFIKLDYKNIIASKKKYLLCMAVQDIITQNLDFFKQLDSFLAENNKQLLLCTDNFHNINNFSNIKIICHDVLVGINYIHVDPSCYSSLENNYPEKLFNSFMQRTESTRQSWLYFLYHHKLIDQGYVSYLCYQIDEYSTLRGLELYDYIHRHYKLSGLAHFEEAYHAMRPHIPFQNFLENNNLVDKILNSKYSLVLDTCAVHDDTGFWFISEKICRALMLPTCQLFFVQKGMLKKLADAGLELSHSNLNFDHLEWVQRQQKILEILLNDPDEYNFKYLKSRALHNYNIFKTMYDANIDQFYNELIELAQT